MNEFAATIPGMPTLGWIGMVLALIAVVVIVGTAEARLDRRDYAIRVAVVAAIYVLNWQILPGSYDVGGSLTRGLAGGGAAAMSYGLSISGLIELAICLALIRWMALRLRDMGLSRFLALLGIVPLLHLVIIVVLLLPGSRTPAPEVRDSFD